MIKKILRRVSEAVCLLALSGSVHATAIFLEPVEQFIDLGVGFTLDVNVSGLGAGSAPSLGAWDIDLTYDPTVVTPVAVLFGDPVLGNQLDLFGFGLNPVGGGISAPGVLDIFEISLDFPDDLDLFQADAFTLAQVTFATIAKGVSSLSISDALLSDSLGGEIPVLSIGSARVKVVPVPHTLALFAVGLFGLHQLRRARRQRFAKT